MSIVSLRPDSPGVDQDAPRERGTLRIELPHWAAQVRVDDDRARAVAGLGAPRRSAGGPGIYEVEVVLPPGIYEVRAALAGAAERELVPVRANSTTTVARARWESLGLPTAAPLAISATANMDHAAAATEWSRSSTWDDAPGGDSRLFLFVRTADAKRHPHFAAGLQLLDAAGRLVTDFREGTKHDRRQGWMACNAALPAGYYIVRRGRPGVPVRYQPVYLVDGWTTQLFLEGGGYPSLHTAALNMTPRNAGFRADDEAFTAAEVLLRSLDRPEIDVIVASEQVTSLLTAETPNPWLAIVAATALHTPRAPQARSTTRDDAPRRARLPRSISDAFADLDEHPDVRALRLRDGRAAAQPLAYPPMLRHGLALALRHATRHAGTIPFDSLTDRVLDNLLTKSPWTAWHALDPRQEPEPATPLPGIGRGPSLLQTRPMPRPDPGALVVIVSTALIDVASPAAPVFYLARRRNARHWQVASIMLANLLEGLAAPDFPRDDPVVQTALMMVRPWSVDAVPERIAVDVDRGLRRLLALIDPEAIAAASRQPLARIEQSLRRLREDGDDGEIGLRERIARQPVTLADQAILTSAVQQVVAAVRTLFGAPAAARSPARSGTPLVSIEESAAKLRAEADRILLAADALGQQNEAAQARRVAGRLRLVADTLLAGAGYTVITDERGRFVFGNGAFRDLLRPPDEKSRGEDVSAAAQRAWEEAIMAAPLGQSVLVSPVANAVAAAWDLRRTAIADAASDEIDAYLNVLRNREAPTVSGAMLGQMEPLLAKLALLAPLFAYGAAEERAKHLDELDALSRAFVEVEGSPSPRHQPVPPRPPQRETPLPAGRGQGEGQG